MSHDFVNGNGKKAYSRPSLTASKIELGVYGNYDHSDDGRGDIRIGGDREGHRPWGGKG